MISDEYARGDRAQQLTKAERCGTEACWCFCGVAHPKADEADQSCEGRTKGDLRSLICGTCKTFYDEPPTKGQLDALVKAALCHLDDLLRAEEQPTAAPAAAEGARAQKPSALWQWGIPEPSQKKAARDCERSTTEKCTSVKT